MTPVERLLERRVVTETGCWELAGQPNRRYGTVFGIYAHRLAYETWRGPIEAGQIICHRCDNPPCFNPAHLYAGSRADNLFDAALRGGWRPSPRRETCQRGHPMVGRNVYRRLRNGKERRECAKCRLLASARFKGSQASEQDRDAADVLGEVVG